MLLAMATIPTSLVFATNTSNIPQLKRQVYAITQQMSQLQHTIDARDETLAELQQPTTSMLPSITLPNVTSDTSEPPTTQPWHPIGYKQSVDRATQQYITEREAQCAEKINNYQTKHDAAPTNEFYTYKLEKWRRVCNSK